MRNVLILIGPSAGGKSTLCQHITSKNFREIISTTTRAPRTHEQHGVDYDFISEDTFVNHVTDGNFIEYIKYCGNFYGNLKEYFDWQLTANDLGGFNSVIITELEGAVNIKDYFWETSSNDVKCVVAMCYVPPKIQKQRLIKRLLQDVNSSENEQIATRHLETFFDRAKNSLSEYDWIKHPAVDILLCCDDGSEEQNLCKINSLFE